MTKGSVVFCKSTLAAFGSKDHLHNINNYSVYWYKKLICVTRVHIFLGRYVFKWLGLRWTSQFSSQRLEKGLDSVIYGAVLNTTLIDKGRQKPHLRNTNKWGDQGPYKLVEPYFNIMSDMGADWDFSVGSPVAQSARAQEACGLDPCLRSTHFTQNLHHSWWKTVNTFSIRYIKHAVISTMLSFQ